MMQVASRTVVPRVVRFQSKTTAIHTKAPTNKAMHVSAHQGVQRTGSACAASLGAGRRGMISKVTGAVFATSLFGMGVSGRPQSAIAYSSAIESVLLDPDYPPEWPFRKEDFARYDESTDDQFYSQPRFVTHIDDPAINAITKYYAKVFPESGRDDVAILDVCSSWISHYPKGYKAGRISGLGMNQEELARNPILNDFVVQDLNENPVLPFPDNTFDVVTNAVSVDYLNKPLEMFREMQRVLKPGGQAIMSFSNRCFPTKAIAIWTATGDPDHVWIVGAYYHYAGGFEAPTAKDISPNPGKSDPMYVVTATKKA